MSGVYNALSVHIRIRPNRGWTALDPRALWDNRELLYFLIWRDLKVRYAQTALGTAWAVLQPLSMMLLFTVLFSRLAGMRSNPAPYPLFAYAALLPWTFFSSATTHAAHSLVGNAHILTKVYFPRVLIPLAAVLSCLVDLLLGLTMVAPLMVFYDVAPGWHLLWLPAAIALTTVVALGTGIWIAAVNVKYRDVRFALPFAIQLWLFATPVAYPPSLVGGSLAQAVLGLNPMAGVVEGFRWVLLGSTPPSGMLAISTVMIILVLVSGVFYFRTMERTFADVI